MNNIKLVAIDIGGTLITDDNKITEENIEILKKIKSLGIKISLVTARMYSSTKYISNLIDADFGVFGNGSNVMNLKDFNTYYSEIIPNQIVKELVNFGKENDMYIHLSQLLCETSDENKYFLRKHNILNQNYSEELKSNIKKVDDLNKYVNVVNDVVNVIFVTEKNMDEFIGKFKLKFPNLFITEYNKNLYETAINQTINYLEIGIKNTTKLDGLKELIKQININAEEVLVIGDGNNDVEMFNYFKNSGCLLNGSEKAKKVANYISKKTNNDSGVSEIIKYYMKGLVK